MKFFIEQIALCPRDPDRAIALLAALGLDDWVRDVAVAQGKVFEDDAAPVAKLAFNYQASPEAMKPLEVEVLHYIDGDNWMKYGRRANSISHLGMHCSAEELEGWRAVFKTLGYKVAQEVRTVGHTNPVIAGKRVYDYVIFDTREVLGVDLKFIVRHVLDDKK